MKKQLSLRRNLLALLLITLFSGFYAGATMCYHKHGDEGTVLVHSHLFGERQHSHDENAWETMEWIYAGLLLLVVSFSVLTFFSVPLEFLVFSTFSSRESVFKTPVCLRGPPKVNLS